jgi:hypothetical protein
MAKTYAKIYQQFLKRCLLGWKSLGFSSWPRFYWCSACCYFVVNVIFLSSMHKGYMKRISGCIVVDATNEPNLGFKWENCLAHMRWRILLFKLRDNLNHVYRLQSDNRCHWFSHVGRPSNAFRTTSQHFRTTWRKPDMKWRHGKPRVTHGLYVLQARIRGGATEATGMGHQTHGGGGRSPSRNVTWRERTDGRKKRGKTNNDEEWPEMKLWKTKETRKTKDKNNERRR